MGQEVTRQKIMYNFKTFFKKNLFSPFFFYFKAQISKKIELYGAADAPSTSEQAVKAREAKDANKIAAADLAAAVEAVSKGKSLREKAEALQFLTDSQRAAYSAASSVVAMAKAAEAPVVTVNGKLFVFSFSLKC